MFMRYKMRSTLKTLKSAKIISDKKIINSIGIDVLQALADEGCIDIFYSDNRPYAITYNGHASLYLLKRSEIWSNRLWGFFLGLTSGILTTLLITYLLQILK